MMHGTAVVWLRKDLRIQDNPALFQACAKHTRVIPVYILDASWMVLGGAQKWWLHHSLKSLKKQLKGKGMILAEYSGAAENILQAVIKAAGADAVYWNEAVDAVTREGDKQIRAHLEKQGVQVKTYAHTHLFCNPETVRNKSGGIFKVFTPFWKHCLEQMTVPECLDIGTKDRTVLLDSEDIDTWGLLPEHPNWAKEFPNHWQPGHLGAEKKLDDFIQHALSDYAKNRNDLWIQGTSMLSPHIHFGEISVWQIYRRIQASPSRTSEGARVFLSQLGWREFSYYLMHHFPEIVTDNFKRTMDAFPWQENAIFFDAWKKGRTGYPIIDAGMRQLWHSGTMHNRMRMIVASFLTKNLMMHWSVGAKWFMNTLLDADEANNTAGWQWVAGCGADASPYFRIFNPILQGQKFDPEGVYVKQWIPELRGISGKIIHDPEQWSPLERVGTMGYPAPIVSLAKTRDRALAAYQQSKTDVL